MLAASIAEAEPLQWEVDPPAFLVDVLEWSMAFYVQRGSLEDGQIEIELNPALGSVKIHIPLHLNVLGDISSGLLDLNLWALHTTTVRSQPRGLSYNPLPPHSGLPTVSFSEPIHGAKATTIQVNFTGNPDHCLQYFHTAMHRLQYRRVWFLDIQIMCDNVLYKNRIRPGDLKLAPKILFNEITDPLISPWHKELETHSLGTFRRFAVKRLGQTVMRRLVVDKSIADGHNTLSGGIEVGFSPGTRVMREGTCWRWIAFIPEAPLPRTKAFVFTDGKPFRILETLDLPAAFWDLNLIVFMTVKIDTWWRLDMSYLKELNRSFFYEAVYSLVEDMSKFRPVVKLWIATPGCVSIDLINLETFDNQKLSKMLQEVASESGRISTLHASIQGWCSKNLTVLGSVSKAEDLLKLYYTKPARMMVVVKAYRKEETQEEKERIKIWRPYILPYN